MKKLIYGVSSEAYTLKSILEDYSYKIGNYKTCIKGSWVFNPQILINLIMEISCRDEEEKLTFDLWVAWQDLLRRAAYHNQRGISLLTDRSLNVKTMQLHHALITKGMIRGKKGLDKNLIHHSYNVMLLNQNEHLDGQDGADNRELCARKLSELYGKRQVKLWYWSYPMKSKLPNVFE